MSPVLVVGYLLLFFGAAVAVVLGGLLIGRLLRPHNPTPVKGDIYECGEPALGTADVQFDLRYYVVALVFLVFDVEVAFFFPWAVVFGKAMQLADPRLPEESQVMRLQELGLIAPDWQAASVPTMPKPEDKLPKPGSSPFQTREAIGEGPLAAGGSESGSPDVPRVAVEIPGPRLEVEGLGPGGQVQAFGKRLARLAIIDIALFFGILMVGFAYVWYRGDLNWIRTPPRGESGSQGMKR